MSRIHATQPNPIQAQLLAKQQAALARTAGTGVQSGGVQSLGQGVPFLLGSGSQAYGQLLPAGTTAASPATPPARASTVQTNGQDTLTLSAAAMQALQGQSADAAPAAQADPTYPTYQGPARRQRQSGAAQAQQQGLSAQPGAVALTG